MPIFTRISQDMGIWIGNTIDLILKIGTHNISKRSIHLPNFLQIIIIVNYVLLAS